MTPDWQTNTAFFSERLPGRHPTLWKELSEILQRHGVPVQLLTGTRDIWARDFMPVQIAGASGTAARFMKFVYDPDYLANDPHLVTLESICDEASHLGTIDSSGIKLDGGNIVSSTRKVIVADKVFEENSSWPSDRLLVELRDVLEVDEVIVIPTDPEDEIGHADGVVRFIDDNLVVVSDYSSVDGAYASRLHRSLADAGLQIVEMPFFCTEEQGSDGISSAVGNYVNFLRIGDLVVVPSYGVPEDQHAADILADLIPGGRIHPLRCNDLAGEGGVLNCVSWTAGV